MYRILHNPGVPHTSLHALQHPLITHAHHQHKQQSNSTLTLVSTNPSKFNVQFQVQSMFLPSCLTTLCPFFFSYSLISSTLKNKTLKSLKHLFFLSSSFWSSSRFFLCCLLSPCKIRPHSYTSGVCIYKWV